MFGTSAWMAIKVGGWLGPSASSGILSSAKAAFTSGELSPSTQLFLLNGWLFSKKLEAVRLLKTQHWKSHSTVFTIFYESRNVTEPAWT